MKFKKNWKRFWTLNRHHAEGFTLVELIVVIAILAILGGIAVPAYSGYVEKAERAADEQLLAAVNTAFAAACAINGENHYGRSDVDITLGGSEGAMTVDAVAVTGIENFDTSFGTFYEGGEFKVFTELYYNSAIGGFKVEELVTYMYNGNPIEVSSKVIDTLKNSTFGDIGGEELLKEVASLTGLIGSGDIDAEALLADEDYMRSFAAYLGVENANTADMATISAAIDAKMADVNEEEAANAMVNGLVYYAAERSTQMDSSEITAFLTSGNISGNLASDQPTKLAQASMAYGMYTAFVNSQYNTGGATSTSNDPMAAIKTISGSGAHSEAFNTYITSAQGQADLEAYMAAMDVINSSTGNDATKDVLVNGFDDPELIALLVQAIGK